MMSRRRTRSYIDVYLTDNEVKKVKKGYLVSKGVTKNGVKLYFCIRNSSDRGTHRKIEKLKAEIRSLKKSRR